MRAHETPEEHEAAEARRRKGLIIGISVGAAIILVALVVMASVLNSIFGDVGGGLNRDELGLNAPSANSEDNQDNSSAATGSTVKPVRATVFSPEGEADSPATAGQAIDGSSSTAWSTDTYSDPAPFPGFKNGVGLMLQLPQPTVGRLGHPERDEHRHLRADPLGPVRHAVIAVGHHRTEPGDTAEARLQHHLGEQGVIDLLRSGVDLDAGHRGRQEPHRHLRNHHQSGLLNRHPQPGLRS